MSVKHLSAVTLAVKDTARSVAFYQRLGFTLTYGGLQASFTSLRFGEAYVNLVATPDYDPRWWGRAIFRVDDVDAYHRSLVDAGLRPEEPRDGSWGERYFHLVDPDGHELSFAQPIPTEPR